MRRPLGVVSYAAGAVAESAAGVAAMMAELVVTGPEPTGMDQMKKRPVVAIKRQVVAEPVPRRMGPNCLH